jgi:hypothetical protein
LEERLISHYGWRAADQGVAGRSFSARSISRRRAPLAAGHSEISSMLRRQPMHQPRASSRQMSTQGEATAQSPSSRFTSPPLK